MLSSVRDPREHHDSILTFAKPFAKEFYLQTGVPGEHALVQHLSLIPCSDPTVFLLPLYGEQRTVIKETPRHFVVFSGSPNAFKIAVDQEWACYYFQSFEIGKPIDASKVSAGFAVLKSMPNGTLAYRSPNFLLQ